MSGITDSGGKVSPISSFKKSEVKSSQPKKVLKNISPSGKKEEILDVNGLVENVEKTITIKKRLPVIVEIPSYKVLNASNKLIKALAISTAFEKQQLKDTIALFDPGEHSFQYGDHIIYVSKPEDVNEPIILGIANVAQKSFAKGGFGKVYDVDLINSDTPLVLKLSRKKLKSKGVDGRLIPLNPEERKLVAERGSSRGSIAKKDLIKEYQMMHFIKNNPSHSEGLFCDAYAFVTYKNQCGLFLKKCDFDGSYFSLLQPSSEYLLDVTQQICRGFDNLSKLKILHRDIKIENTLFEVTQDSNDELDFTAVISDFGGACFYKDLFDKNPYPTLTEVLGNGTKRNISFQIAYDINEKLMALRKFDVESEKYNEIANEILKLMVRNDEFSLSILLYRLWTGAEPPFLSYANDDFMKFDSGLTKEGKLMVLEQMELEIYSNCQSLQQDESKIIVDLIMGFFEVGLNHKRGI